MAKVNQIGSALSQENGTALAQADRLEALIDAPAFKKRFQEVLGAKANQFVSSVISAYKTSPKLMECDPKSIISSAMIAAQLDLPINQSLGFAYIVPYKGVAQFQMGYKGFIQLGIRSGGYQTMNASEVYEDEIEFFNPITGELKLTPMEQWKQRYANDGKVVGYCAYLRMVNGFEKFLYMTVEQIEAHARAYSKSYAYDLKNGSRSSKWSTDFGPMALKTVIKLLLSKFGMLSVDYQMQKALQADQAAVDINGEVINYPDNDAIEPAPTEDPKQ